MDHMDRIDWESMMVWMDKIDRIDLSGPKWAKLNRIDRIGLNGPNANLSFFFLFKNSAPTNHHCSQKASLLVFKGLKFNKFVKKLQSFDEGIGCSVIMWKPSAWNHKLVWLCQSLLRKNGIINVLELRIPPLLPSYNNNGL